jgi:hypothetical protein
LREHSEEQIKEIIAGKRKVLLRATDDVYTQADAANLSARFSGCCGLAQCVAGYHFRRDVDGDELSRENLAQRGWSIS